MRVAHPGIRCIVRSEGSCRACASVPLCRSASRDTGGHKGRNICLTAQGSCRRISGVLVNADVRPEDRSLEQTKAGGRFKAPTTAKGKRTVSLPPIAVEALRAHRRGQLELRLALGQGKPEPDALVFCDHNGDPIPPNNLSRDWARFVKGRKLPPISFHGLRHSHVSALIAKGVDVLTVSRRIGHASPVVTMRVYAHLFSGTDKAAADAIEAVLRTGRER